MTWLKKAKVAPKTSIACLQAFRIISRDKSNMQALTNENALMTLNKVAGIQHYATQDVDDIAVDIVPADQAGTNSLSPIHPQLPIKNIAVVF